jgi:predicted DNA-binding transcriptional regulator YafY
MKQEFSEKELKSLFKIVKAIDEGLIVNPSEEWEPDYHDEPLIDRKSLKSILKKIEKCFSGKDFDETRKNLLRRKYDTFNNEINEGIYKKIEKAFNDGKTIEIGYFDMNSGKVRKRQINVYHKTRKYIIAYCHLRKEMRKFRTSRITSAEITDSSYTIPESFDKNKY